MKGIVIKTSEATQDWLPECLESIKNAPYSVLIVKDDGWELGAILAGYRAFDEFIFIHDTTIVNDITLFDKLFAIEGHVALTEKFFHYMGKYVSNDMPLIPIAKTKEDAVFHETKWFTQPYTIFEPQLPVSSSVREIKHDRENMVVTNGYITKYKNTFTL